MVRDPKSEVDMGIQCLIIIYILITHILYIEQNKIYNSAKEFCEIMGFDYSNCHISEICKHKYGFKTYKGYHFEYINNYEREEDIEKID